MTTVSVFIIGAFFGMAIIAMAIAARESRQREQAFYGWGARDKDGSLWVHESEPIKDIEGGLWVTNGGNSTQIFPESFASIKWTDRKATRVMFIRERRHGDD